MQDWQNYCLVLFIVHQFMQLCVYNNFVKLFWLVDKIILPDLGIEPRA